MTLGLLFWVLYIIGFFVGFAFADRARPYWYGFPTLTYILIGILGWHAFGPVVR